MKMVLILLLLALAAMIVLIFLWQVLGFRLQDPDDYAGSGPNFDLTRHLNGQLVSEGTIFGPLSRVNSRFVAQMDGEWQDGTGILKETFVYSGTGHVQTREWTLTLLGDGKFTGTAPDIVGTAQGKVSGATARLSYRIRLPESAGGHILSVTDWMYLMDNGNIINRSEMRKFGLKVAELVATIRPKGN